MSGKLLTALARKKTDCDTSESKLNRVLNLLDLTALGVGATLGLGVYVLTSTVAKSYAGPASALSFLIAAIASAIAGLCYAEFASRVPKAGSAYVYSYVTVGEFIAYVIGWNLLLEYIIGTASVARAFTSYLDALIDHEIQKTLTDWFPMHVSFLSPFPDFVSFIFVLILTVLLSIGVKESSKFNNVFTIVNLLTISIVLVGAGMKADISNWTIKKGDIPANFTDDAGDGGFAPFGFEGIMAGAAKCFYAFVGFDAIATTGEEAKNPQRNIPLAIVMSLLIAFLAYFGVSSVLTLAWPYYDQDKDAPFPVLFDHLDMPVIKWIVTIGALCALSTSLLGAMFPLPRVLYAMGDDGLIFKSFASIHPRFKTPLTATVISGIFSGLMAVIFDVDQLISMMSIGTLLAYTIVAICVLILRYEPCEENRKYISDMEKTNYRGFFPVFKLIFNLNNNKEANMTTEMVIKWATAIFSILSIVFGSFPVFALDKLMALDPPYTIGFILVSVCLLINLVIIGRQPVDDIKLAFKVPLVPLIPCMSIIVNFYLMLELDGLTWIRFIIWLAIGFLIYFFYGIKHSREGLARKKELEIMQSELKSSNGSQENTLKY